MESPKGPPTSFPRAEAKGVSFADRFSILIEVPPSDLRKDGKGITSFRLGFFDSIREISPSTADELTLRFGAGTTSSFALQKSTFKCIDCSDDEIKTTYHAAFALANPKRINDTRLEVTFQQLSVINDEEQYSMTPLDFLGNFAGMLGALLGVSVITALDRFLSYAICHSARDTIWPL